MNAALLPPVWLYAIAFVIGATLTSFSRLAVVRLPHQLAWRADANPALKLWSPPSYCDGCGARIRAAHLLPVLGWLLAAGRCPVCRMRISFWHPLFELLGGLGVVLALFWFGTNNQGYAAAGLWLTLLFLAEIDWREQWLPALVTYPLFWYGLLLSPFTAQAEMRTWGAFTGCVLMWLAMMLAGLWRGEDALAGGDIALAAAAGAWLGLGRMPLFLALTCMLFVLYALPLRFRGQVWVPMGPALAGGFLLCLPSQSLL